MHPRRSIPAEHFNAMLPELTQHFRVITPDPRAQGRSTDTEEPLTYAQIEHGETVVTKSNAKRRSEVVVVPWKDYIGSLRPATDHPRESMLYFRYR